MVKNLLYLVVGAVFLTGCLSVQTSGNITAQKQLVVSTQQHAENPVKVLRHVVLLKFKDGTTSQQIKDVEGVFCALPSKISAINDFEWGTDVSVEKRSEGFTHCMIFTFLSEVDRDKYLPHPAHQELVSMSRPYLDKILVIDFWAKP